MIQADLFPDDGISRRALIFCDPDEKPDFYGRRRFILEWNDAHAFAPGAPRNPDGTVTRGQAFYSDPQRFIAEGYEVRA